MGQANLLPDRILKGGEKQAEELRVSRFVEAGSRQARS